MIPKELAALTELGLVAAPGGKSPAFTATGDRLVDARAFAALKSLVKDAPGATVRVNLHPGPDAPVHDMIIAQSAGGKPFVHKHLTREETYHMIEGRMRLQFFDDAGKPSSSHLLGGPGTGLPLIVRVPKGVWHASVAETDFVVFHESRPGPFDGGDTVFPHWEPA